MLLLPNNNSPDYTSSLGKMIEIEIAIFFYDRLIISNSHKISSVEVG